MPWCKCGSGGGRVDKDSNGGMLKWNEVERVEVDQRGISVKVERSGVIVYIIDGRGIKIGGTCKGGRM